MEDVKRLSIDGKDFTIEDVELRSGPAWANGPRRIDAELPDGQVLGSIMASDGEWLWRLAGEKWNHTEPAEGPIAEYIGHEPNPPPRPSEAYCRPSMTGIPPQRPTTHGHPCRMLPPPPCRMPSARPNRHRSGSLGFGLPRRERPCPTRIQASTKAPCPPGPGIGM